MIAMAKQYDQKEQARQHPDWRASYPFLYGPRSAELNAEIYYQTATPPSVRGSVPPHSTPVSGSLQMTCPRPNEPKSCAT